MKMSYVFDINDNASRWGFWIGMCLVLLVVLGAEAQARESDSAFESFIEPYKTVKISASEIGTLLSIEVKEGQSVSAGMILARMDDRVLQASLAAARAAKESTGNLKAAQAELALKKRLITSLEGLHARGNATQRELDRAQADLELCQARLQAVGEELQVRAFEYQRIAAQIEKRILRSPIDGVVESIEKSVGEFLSPTDPTVVTVVQLDSVLAVFSLPINMARKIQPGRSVVLRVGADEQQVQGIVDFVAPTADAQSGTMRVKVRIPNANGRVLSGSSCRWDVDEVLQSKVATMPNRALLFR